MIAEICAYLKNYFDVNEPYRTGEIEIHNGALYTSCDLKANQYFHIIGSTFNDGVYQYPTTSLVDETFNGTVRGMALPFDFLDLVDDIETWQAKYGKSVNSPYASESVTSNSYSRTKVSSADVNAISWQSAFAGRLARWRKL